MTVSASAPARANLIGEHTDYNNGFVLPTPIPFYTTVTLSSPDLTKNTITISSDSIETPRTRTIGEPPAHDWTDYVMGCLSILEKNGIKVPGVNIHIHSDIPMGAGISSSAALLVATLRAFRALLSLSLTDQDIATMAHQAERTYVGVPCGVMDQSVCSLGKEGYAFMLDTQDLHFEQVPLPSDRVVILVNCGKKHHLASGDGYRQRVAECQEACKILGIKSLRELSIDDLSKIDALPDLIKRRAKHVITENHRVVEACAALRNKDSDRFGELMAQSHDSQRDDYEVSIPEINALVESSRRFGIRAARLTGGGFGGSIVGLIPKDLATAWWQALKAENPDCTLISTYAV